MGNLWKVDSEQQQQQQQILSLLARSSLDRAAADRAASGLLWLDAAVQAYMSV